MSYSTSYLAYDDCRQALERAVKSKKGIRLEFKSEAEAIRFVARANAFRRLDRVENTKLYDEIHTMYGHSAYDVLAIRRKGATVEIVPISLDPLTVIDLDGP